ncbi:ABC-F family ATP-binding cassette domain-containing protein [Martelella alba]|uniref:ABC-F family ATP-binding cassette domain-containing protein n=1 Tax=Martelella alba TaxID=2590451 RepID=A0A506U5X4_9HYPH|nr:ABC-F family ATP-binding cassette domain-containing protein [Martelella alba]TPW27989.1 ABC-F family ATP-binding cassette domain-containing protein [Martelella alba]
MPNSVILSDLSYRTDDGHFLFQDINCRFGSGLNGLIGRNGIGKSTLLALIAGHLAPTTGHIAVPARIGLLDQSFSCADGDCLSDLFGLRDMLALTARAEAGTLSADELLKCDWSAAPRACAALERLGLEPLLDTPLSSLSGGQLSRARLAALNFAEPDFLLLDEPSNNLDRQGRAALCRFLENWQKGAIIVSHDRELLDRMDNIVEMSGHGVARYGGNFADYEAAKETERAVAERTFTDALKQKRKTVDATRRRAESKARRDANGRRMAARGDQPRIVAGGLKRKAEATSGRMTMLNARQEAAAADALKTAKARFDVVDPFTVTLPPSGLAADRQVIRVEALCGGYGGKVLFSGLSFEFTGPFRTAIAGRNGSGKSTLLAILTGRLAPLAGQAQIFVPYVFLDQQVSILDDGASLAENYRRLNGGESENECRAALARFRFRAEAALRPAGELSGGERMRAGLACVLGSKVPPSLLILDEPTNHLDLDSIAILEAGLNAYDGAILLVSHDRHFCQATGINGEVYLT